MTRAAVVLPAPLVPSRATTSPWCTSKRDVGERPEVAIPGRHVVEREDGARVVLDLVRRDARHQGFAAGAQVAGDDLRLGQHLLDGAVGDEAAEVEHGDPVAALGDDVHDVLDDHDGLDAVAQRLDDLDELEDLGLDEAGADLVHEQDARLERQRARQLEPLELQQREVLGLGLGDRPTGPSRAGSLSQSAWTPPSARGAAAVVARHQEVLEHRHLRGTGLRDLVRAADAHARPPVRRHVRDVGAVVLHGAAVGVQGAAQHADERALAGAVGADDAEHLAAAHLEVDLGHGDHVAVALGDGVGPQHAPRRASPAGATLGPSAARPAACACSHLLGRGARRICLTGTWSAAGPRVAPVDARRRCPRCRSARTG